MNVFKKVIAACILGGAMTAAIAQSVPAAGQRTPIPPQSLIQALNDFAAQTGLQLMYVSGLAEGRQSKGSPAGLPPAEMLAHLLEGTTLTFEFLNDRTIAIRAIKARSGADAESKPTADGAPAGTMHLAQVDAQDADGSGMSKAEPGQQPQEIVVRGTYNYAGTATVGGKTVQSLREIPQSISIITRQRLDDQNINTLPEALKFTTGVTAFRGDGVGNFNSYYARGYPADSFLLDGLNMGRVVNMIEQDLAVFERIEVLRGPAGLFQGAGEPGVTISLARKRALERAQLKTAMTAGSWNSYRGELDATGSLTDSGGLRGRVVGVYDDRDSYLENAGSRKKLIYGTTEFDLSDHATMSLGGTFQDVQAVIMQGLPAYSDGRMLDVPRSTSVAADWNSQDMQTIDAFAEIESHFGDALLKLAFGRELRDMSYQSARGNGLVDDTSTVNLQRVAYEIEQTDTTADVYFSTPFEFAGRRHNFLIGGDYRTSSNSAAFFTGPPAQGDILDFDQNIPYPVFEEDLSSRIRTTSEGYGVYSQLRLQVMGRLKLLFGGRLSWARSTVWDRVTGDSLGRAVANSELTPYGGVIFDLNSVFSLYSSYSSIFKPQSGRTFAGDQLKPRTGNQYEAGFKGEFLNGQLNAHAAVFRLTDENRELADLEHEGFALPNGRVRSEGAEAEISGKLAPGWSVVAGYAYNTSKYLKADEGQNGQTYSTFTPKHTGNIWTHYVVQGDFLRGLELGVGARAVSEFYSLRGVRFVGDPYTIVSSQIGYTFARRHKVAVNFENLLDKKYYEQVNFAGRQNFYGAPRSVMLTLRSQF